MAESQTTTEATLDAPERVTLWICCHCHKPRTVGLTNCDGCQKQLHDTVQYSRVSASVAPSVDNLQRRLYEECITASWDPERKNTFAEEIAHLHEELSEAFRAWRRYKDCEVREVNGKLEGVPIEFADALIGMFYNAELYGFDLLAAVERKHRFNLNRNYVVEGRQLHATAPASTVAPQEQSDGPAPMCEVHQRLDDAGKLECEIGNSCVACSLNERRELLALIAPFAADGNTEDSVTVLRRVAEFYQTHAGEGRVVVSYPATSPAAPSRQYFCSCGATCTAEEYIEHYFEQGHDRGDLAFKSVAIRDEADGRQRAVKLLRQLRETTDPAEVERQKESWQQLEEDLSIATISPSTRAKAAAIEIINALNISIADKSVHDLIRLRTEIGTIIDRCFSAGGETQKHS